MITTVAEVEKQVLDFIQDPQTKPTFCNKLFLKTLICDVLKLNIDHLKGVHRTNLYTFTKNKIKAFRKELNDKSLLSFKQYMESGLRKELARIAEDENVVGPDKLKKMVLKVNLKKRLAKCKVTDTLELEEDDSDDETLARPCTSASSSGKEKTTSEDGISMDVDDSTLSNLVEDNQDSDNSDRTLVIAEHLDSISDSENANHGDSTLDSNNVLLNTSFKDPAFQPVVQLEKLDSISPPKAKTPVPKAVTPPLLSPLSNNSIQDVPPNKRKDRTPAKRRESVASSASKTSRVSNTSETTSARKQTAKRTPKQTTPQTKKPPVRVPKDSFRTNIRDFMLSKCRRENELVFSTNPTVLRNSIFELNPDSSVLSISQGQPIPMDQNLDHFELKHLLHWPGISLTINFPELEITRQCVSNFGSELVKIDHFPDHVVANDTQLKRYYQNQTMKSIAQDPSKDIGLCHDLIILYLELILKAATESTSNRLAEVVLLLETLIEDFQKLKRSFLNIDYSYFLNEFAYNRLIVQPGLVENDDVEYLHLKETYNPEIVFKINRAKCFEENREDDDFQMDSYFVDLLQDKKEAALNSFKLMLQRSVTAVCNQCAYKHQGWSMMVSIMKDHIKECSAIPLKCVACDYKSSELELASRKWKHNCVKTAKEKGEDTTNAIPFQNLAV